MCWTDVLRDCHSVNFLFQESMTVIPDALVDESVTWNQNFKQYQFERNGYFAVDSDSTPSKVRHT